MTDPFRGGGFGGVGLGPFQTGGGGDSRYLIADDGDAVAQTRKYTAQIRWANGNITDDEYLKELRIYLGTTEKGTRERTAAQNEYDDAEYTIGRNKLVRLVNNAATAVSRVGALRRLIGYDRARLSGMKRDNEQYRELTDRITDAEGQVREVRYGELVRRFNQEKIGLAPLLAFARQAAAASQGGPDHADWLDRIDSLTDQVENEKLAKLYQDWEHGRVDGGQVIDFLQRRLSGMNPDSPEAKETARTIEDLTKRVREQGFAERDQEMAAKVRAGTISDADYVRYLHKRIDDYDPGTSEFRAARQTWLDGMFSLGESRIIRGMESGDMEGLDLAKFYRTHMATMDPGSGRFLELQAKVNDLMVSGTSTLALFGGRQGIGNYSGTGRLVDLTGQPGGTPVNARGFASQFDGSAFANANCWAASAAMAAWQATGGRIAVSGGDIRYYSGDREGGGSYSGVATAYQQLGLGLREMHGMGFDAFTKKVMSGKGAMLAGSYADMDPRFKLSDFTGPHSIFISKAKRSGGQVWFFVMDPLGRSTAEGGQWVPAQSIKAFGWSNSANEGGGAWYGDVGFVTGSKHVVVNGDSPPFQAFDTDAQGNSTVGRGGGSNRQEAGRRRDWSKGKAREADPWKGKPSTDMPTGFVPESMRQRLKAADAAVTDEMVSEFLAAVDSTDPPLLDASQWGVRPQADDPEKLARARALLGEYGGDARLAAVAWFTGSATTDTKQWTATQRFYANAVGTRLGYEAIPKGGVGDIDPMKPPSPLDLVTPGARPTEVGLERSPGQAAADLTGIAPDAAEVGRLLLQKLGIEPTPDMVRAIVAWVSTESTNVKGNNPWVLRTQGMNDLPKQIGKDENGVAVFESLDAGVSAAAAEIRRNFPGIIASLRSGDVERALAGIDRSGWAPYNGALVRTFNELPGDTDRRIVIGGLGGGRLLNGASDLRSLSSQEPSIAELFDVDPRDPRQMGWLEANIAAAKEALERGDSTWSYRTPGGQDVVLDFAPGMYNDLTATKVMYADWMAQGAVSKEDQDKWDGISLRAHEEHESGVVTIAADEWTAHMDALGRVRDRAYGAGDIASAAAAIWKMKDATAIYLGLDPNGPLDANQSWRKGDLEQAGKFDDVLRAVDGLDARSAENPSGDPLVELMEQGLVIPRFDERGDFSGMTIPSEAAYFMWDGGKPVLRTVLKDERDFEPVPMEDPTAPGTFYDVPRYVTENVAVTLGGRTAMAPISQTDMRVASLTSDGYKRAEVAAPPVTGTRTLWSPPGGPTNQLGQIQNPILSVPGGGQQQRSRIITVATREDQQMRVSGSTTIPVSQVSVVDPTTNRLTTWYSLPGSGIWLGGEARGAEKGANRLDVSRATSPTLVFHEAGGRTPTVVNGQIMFGTETYDPAKHGPLTQYVHWYGQRPTDGAKPGEFGAMGSRWRIRQAQPTAGGGMTFDTAPPDITTAFLEGDVPIDHLLGGALGRAPVGARTSSRFEKDDLYAPRASAAARAEDPNLSGLPGVGAAAAREAMQNLADMGYFDGEGLTTAGGVKPPTTTSRPTSMATLGSRLVAGVRTFADTALKVAEAQKAYADAKAAQEAKIRAAEAKQAAAAAARARAVTFKPVSVQSPTPPPTSPRGAQGRGPAPLPDRQPAPTPAPLPTGPRNTPTPPPFDPSSGRTDLRGGV